MQTINIYGASAVQVGDQNVAKTVHENQLSDSSSDEECDKPNPDIRVTGRQSDGHHLKIEKERCVYLNLSDSRFSGDL